MTEQKFQFRQYSIKVWTISLLIFFASLICFIFSEQHYSIFANTTQQTYNLIFILTVSVLIIVGINVYFSKKISINIKNDSIQIMDLKSGITTNILSDNIDDYYFSYTAKAMLDILRININGKNNFYWLGGLNSFQESENDNILKQNLDSELKKKLANKVSKTNIDAVILFSASKLSYIMVAFSLIALVLFLVYFLFWIK
ncbi:hypothetical protein [Soonwooa sp.]|uniref:hypothetical protein n=1 Tax=Soonwooa sp. TaxID=1938592 RepID=UPI0026038A2F|nr:hypothetical protein [Soonwooa sp.]